MMRTYNQTILYTSLHVLTLVHEKQLVSTPCEYLPADQILQRYLTVEDQNMGTVATHSLVYSDSKHCQTSAAECLILEG